MLFRPILRGRMGKWSLVLVEFHLVYVPQKAIKGQALANFLVDHPCNEVMDINETMFVALAPWKLNFDGSCTTYRASVGVILESPRGIKTQMAFKLEGNYSNNQIEYEALIIRLEILLETGIKSVEVYGDSQLVIRQLPGDYKCCRSSIVPYFVATRQLLEQFSNAKLNYVP